MNDFPPAGTRVRLLDPNDNYLDKSAIGHTGILRNTHPEQHLHPYLEPYDNERWVVLDTTPNGIDGQYVRTENIELLIPIARTHR